MTANVKRSQKRPGANAFARILCGAAFVLTAAAGARAHPADADIGLRDGEVKITRLRLYPNAP